MITIIGEFFPKNIAFGLQESNIFNSIKNKINDQFSEFNNLIINLTWFGPQFNNNTWDQVQNLIDNNKKFDNLFWTCIVDPLTVLPSNLEKITNKLCLHKNFYMGVAFEGNYSFNTHAIVCLEEFPIYNNNELLLTDVKWLFINYNRKPKPHRITFIEKIFENSVENYGLFSLGKPEKHYDVTNGLATDRYYIVDEKLDYTRNGKFPKEHTFGNVPPDFCSLGDLTIWQTHFLNIVSETEFLPWDNIFVTEKTWKPIIGLRPFVLNGQTKIYKYLRDNGFKTFNHYFNGIELEDIPEYEVHDSIISVIKYLATLDKTEILTMYNNMLPELVHNRNRFFEFAKEQQYKIDHLFE